MEEIGNTKPPQESGESLDRPERTSTYATKLAGRLIGAEARRAAVQEAEGVRADLIEQDADQVESWIV